MSVQLSNSSELYSTLNMAGDVWKSNDFSVNNNFSSSSITAFYPPKSDRGWIKETSFNARQAWIDFFGYQRECDSDLYHLDSYLETHIRASHILLVNGAKHVISNIHHAPLKHYV